jgi:non-homologous end joining protein Ku
VREIEKQTVINGGIEKTVEGQEVKVTPPAPRRTGQVVDIFAALKKSLEEAKPPRQVTAAKKKRKA